MSAPGSGEGARVLAEALKAYGCKYVFGIVGVPVIEVGMAIQQAGLTYIGFRNEQAASYAAGACGYLTGTPGVCLVVSGPGVVHGLAGLANAKENGWPMLLIGGASDSSLDSMMSFQESPQVEFARPYVKYAARFDSVERIPFYVERAVRTSMSGRAGPVYLDLPGDLVNRAPNEKLLVFPPIRGPVVGSQADPREIAKAVKVLMDAKRPLVIVGKGMAIARAENQVLGLVEATGFPYLPTPMGKGVISDAHSQNVIAARTNALKGADVVLLLGARANWINHFLLPPRFAADLKVVQVDILPEAHGDNVPNAASLCGHAPLVLEQLLSALKANKGGFKPLTGAEPWWADLAKSVKANVETSVKLASNQVVPMNYYCPLTLIQDVLRDEYPEAIIVSEGAATMDIGRTIIENYLPRKRLDAATYGSMGPALGQAIAAQVVNPTQKVVCVLGDSSFGFSGMEIETICRYQMPIVIIIINNSGIAMGLPATPGTTLEERAAGVPVTTLLKDARYEKMCEAFGGLGFFVKEPKDVQPAFKKAMTSNMPAVVNIIIDGMAMRRPQQFDWLTRDSAKL